MRVQKYQLATRAVMVYPPLYPEALALLKTLMTAEQVFEKAVEAYWKTQQLVWESELPLRCNLGIGLQKSAFPTFPFPIVDPNLGPSEQRGNHFLLGRFDRISLSVGLKKLRSTAELIRRSKNDWTIRWTQ